MSMTKNSANANCQYDSPVYAVVTTVDVYRKLKDECTHFWMAAQQCKIDALDDQTMLDYQCGVQAAVIALYHRMTGEKLDVEDVR